MRSTVEGFFVSIQQARRLRRTMSRPEAILWRMLRMHPGGHKFRRQHPLGRYVLDFYCHAAGLAIEVDGISHDLGSNPDKDDRRDQQLSGAGIMTLRFAALDVVHDTEAVVTQIVQAACLRTPPSALRTATSPRNRGEDELRP